jgi:hypothetical protein
LCHDEKRERGRKRGREEIKNNIILMSMKSLTKEAFERDCVD